MPVCHFRLTLVLVSVTIDLASSQYAWSCSIRYRKTLLFSNVEEPHLPGCRIRSLGNDRSQDDETVKAGFCIGSGRICSFAHDAERYVPRSSEASVRQRGIDAAARSGTSRRRP